MSKEKRSVAAWLDWVVVAFALGQRHVLVVHVDSICVDFDGRASATNAVGAHRPPLGF